jgi:hypothetical protein
MLQKVCAIFFILVFIYGFPASVFAVSVAITNYPGTITDDSFTFTASISGASSGTNYLRVDVFRDQSSPNYFGETFNNIDWYSGSIYTQYLPITIQSGSWSGIVQGRIGNPTSTQYDGTGIYKIRLRRYTGGGGYTASEANASAVVVSIVVPTATPTPMDPTLTPTPKILTPTKVPTQKINSSPTIKLSSTKTPMPKLTPKPSKKVDKSKSVLGKMIKQSEKDQTKNPSQEVTASKNVSGTPFQAIFVIVGGVLLFACGILIFIRKR